MGSSSSAGLKQQASIVEHTHTVLPSAWCAVFFMLFYSIPDLKQTTNKPVIHVWLSFSRYRRKNCSGRTLNRTIKQAGNKKSTKKIPFSVWVPAFHLVYKVLCRLSPAPLWLLGLQWFSAEASCDSPSTEKDWFSSPGAKGGGRACVFQLNYTYTRQSCGLEMSSFLTEPMQESLTSTQRESDTTSLSLVW